MCSSPPPLPACALRTLPEQVPATGQRLTFLMGPFPSIILFSQNKAFCIAESLYGLVNAHPRQAAGWLSTKGARGHGRADAGPFLAHLHVLVDPFSPGLLPLWLREVQPWTVRQAVRQNPPELAEMKQAVCGTRSRHRARPGSVPPQQLISRSPEPFTDVFLLRSSRPAIR